LNSGKAEKADCTIEYLTATQGKKNGARSDLLHDRMILLNFGKDYFPFFSAVFFAAAAFTDIADFAGLLFPKLPANVFPFFVLMSPRPMIEYVEFLMNLIKKQDA
jgi:hypothetical protein